MKIYEYEGKNIEDINEKVTNELNVQEDDYYLKIIKDGEGGLFKTKKIKVEILKKDDVIDYIKDLLKDITDKMGIKINIEVKKRNNVIKINLYSNNNAILIGKNGKTIESLQKIVKNSILNNTGFFVNIIIDVEEYKEKQYKYIEINAKKIANEVLITGEEKSLDSMNSYERRIVHESLIKFNVETISYGEEPNRYVVIKPKK